LTGNQQGYQARDEITEEWDKENGFSQGFRGPGPAFGKKIHPPQVWRGKKTF